MQSVVSYTTRPKREGEIDGINYHYISKEEFFDKRNNNFFAETASYNVAIDGGQTWYYGSAIKDLTDDKVAIMNPEGLKEIKKIKSLNPIVFHIIADDDTIWNRLRQRGDNSEEARRRLNADDEDFKDINNYIDYAIKNDGSKTPKEIADIIFYLYKKCSQNKEKLYIDFDGVVVNTIKAIVDLYNEDFKYYSKYKPVPWTEINTWGFKELEAATGEQIDHYFNQSRFFDRLVYIDNAKEVLDRLSNKYDITIVSHGYSPNLRLKEKFVTERFPYAKFIGVNLKEHKDKSCVNMSDGIFIDDSYENLKSSNAKKKICFGDKYPWNEIIDSNCIRIFNWCELEKYIEERQRR